MPQSVLSMPETQTFRLSNVIFRRGSIVKSVYVIVVAVSYHHQQSDNFCTIQKENAKWTWAIICVWHFIVLLSSGSLCISVCATLLWGQEGMSVVGLLAVESFHLSHFHWHPLRQGHWTKLNCWACDYWLFGGTVQVVTTLAHFDNLPRPNWCHLTL